MGRRFKFKKLLPASELSETEKLEETRQWAWDNAKEAYEERDLLIAALARAHPSHRMETGRDRVAICIHSPVGQLAWNFPQHSPGIPQVTGPTLREALADIEMKPNDWDGAKTAQRTERLRRLAHGMRQETP